MADDDESRRFSPPYNIPWATFINTIERAANDLPNRIDRSYLQSQAGSVQTYLIAAFKGFALIDDELRPTGLKRFAEQPDNRPQIMAELLQERYGPILELGKSASTSGELHEAFGKTFPTVNGESRKKAIRFFLAATAYAQLPTSNLWKPPKTTTANVRRSARGRGRTPTPPRPPAPAESSRPNGETKVVHFGDAGQVTITVNLKWLELPLEIFSKLREAISMIEGLEEAHAADANEVRPTARSS